MAKESTGPLGDFVASTADTTPDTPGTATDAAPDTALKPATRPAGQSAKTPDFLYLHAYRFHLVPEDKRPEIVSAPQQWVMNGPMVNGDVTPTHCVFVTSSAKEPLEGVRRVLVQPIERGKSITVQLRSYGLSLVEFQDNGEDGPNILTEITDEKPATT